MNRDSIESTTSAGDTEWRRNGTLHRIGGPAIIYADGSEEWWTHGLTHRLDGPAATSSNGNTQWWFAGRLHRVSGPARTYGNGSVEWWCNGVKHRTEGPAVTNSNGDNEWWVSGKRHRLYGPAVVYSNGDEEWWVVGRLHRDGYLPAKNGQCYKRGSLIHHRVLQIRGRVILRFMRWVLLIARMRAIRRGRVVGDAIFQSSGVYFPGLENLIGGY